MILQISSSGLSLSRTYNFTIAKAAHRTSPGNNLKYAHQCKHTCMHAPACTYTHTHTHTKHTYTKKKHTHTKHPHTRTHTHKNTQNTHALTHTQKHMHARGHTRYATHTHIDAPYSLFFPSRIQLCKGQETTARRCVWCVCVVCVCVCVHACARASSLHSLRVVQSQHETVYL